MSRAPKAKPAELRAEIAMYDAAMVTFSASPELFVHRGACALARARAARALAAATVKRTPDSYAFGDGQDRRKREERDERHIVELYGRGRGTDSRGRRLWLGRIAATYGVSKNCIKAVLVKHRAYHGCT